ncbi:MAG: cysteine hydrolase [Enhydrobacter sp.]|nr:MAG: cysteine hydrolase [Enhydrobacter sp.]
MQRLFAEPTDWHVPWLPKVLPQVTAIAECRPERTVFTRFVPPPTPEQAVGAWKDYYRRWRGMARDRLDPALLELVEPLRRLVPPAHLVDKSGYSAFSNPRLAPALRRRGATTLIVSGGETDVCVMATIMGALDHGFRVVLPTDALCSSVDRTHDALLEVYRSRFGQQLATTTAERICARWT